MCTKYVTLALYLPLGVNAKQFIACVQGVDGELIKAIRQNPHNYYINIHTAAVPSGEIRGQLSK